MRKRILAVAVAAATLASGANAAGFYLKEQSVVGQGRAFAGSAAGTDGASAAYFNPAGIVGLDRQVEVGVHVISPDVTVTNSGSSVNVPTGLPLPAPATLSLVGSRTPLEPYEAKPVPNLHFVTPLNETSSIGLAIGAPFGFSNDYGDDAFNSADHQKVAFSTLETSLSLAKKVAPSTNIAVGVVHQSLELDQDKLAADNNVTKLKGKSSEIGFLVAVQHKASDETTLGLTYRSKIEHRMVGTLGTTDVTAPFQIPDILAFGIAHRISDKTTFYADATWYGWATYGTQPINASASGTTITVVDSNYSNTISFGFGVDHDYGNGWIARAGLMIDPTPTNDTDRSTAAPDSDRTWLAAGVSKNITPSLGLDFALTHILAEDGTVNKEITAPLTSSLAGASLGFVKASVKGSTSIASMGLRYKF